MFWNFWVSGTPLALVYLFQLSHSLFFPVFTASVILTSLFFGYSKLVHSTLGLGLFALLIFLLGMLLLHIFAWLPSWHVLSRVSASERSLSYLLTPYSALFFVQLTVSFQYFKIYLFIYVSHSKM